MANKAENKKGRKLVIGYLFLLTLSGPVKNLMRNVKVLGHAVVCGQDQVKLALHDLIHSFKEPLHVIKDAINKMLPLIENVMENVKEKVVNIKDHVIEIVDNIQTSFIWLENVFNFCNEKLGTPFEKCLKLVETSEIRCRKSLTTPSTFCDSTVLAKMFCYSFKTFDGFCKAFTLSDDSLKLILKNVEVFFANIEEMFYVSVQVHHQFDFNTNSSKATHVIVSEIFEDLHERTEIVFNVFGCIEAFMSFFFLWILIKLISHEYRKIFEKSIFLFATSIHVCGILFADYSLFWLLSVIQYYGNQSKDFETEDDLFWISVIGDGVIAEMCQDLVMIFKPLMKSFDLQLKVCLPIPYRPNFSEYAKIGLLVISSWIFLIVEPYAMRLKCVIMSDQYPEKTAERTVWLYYHILRKRTTFFGFIKKQMKQDRNSHAKYRKETCFEIFKAKFDQYVDN
ncbi:CLUMA_CG013402, isoform A [Clunio marinus]|uniref:CLUMA_CG013402, isoform A n=1 Tax=Clunio marinus TaxID=568069 RepID=A0A1J1IK39_9DIPT|nr:CLUMA_CG013402, isoform A [Clunio marinus]